MPMYQTATDLPKQSAVEGDFFKSLSYLTKHYGLNLTKYRQLPYPYNILMAQKEVNRQLKKKGRCRELLIVEQEDNHTCLTVKETFNQDFGLFYIPVMPIYDLWQNPEHTHCAELITAVCAYLYIEADVTYYRDEDTYMFYNYEILEEWITEGKDDMEEDDYNRQKTAYDNALKQGDFIQEKMMATGFRHSLDSLIANFNALSDFEKECLTVAQKCWDLWQTFPKMNLFKHASLQDYEVEDYEDNYVAMHEYFSFVGSVNDSVSDTLRDMVNNDFNERARYQEPEVVTFFNQAQPRYTDELAYEDKLYLLIDDLCTLLYHKP
ncbi:hypothetical protein DIU31_022665 [Mucilaginibacter rubeus]|uniref:PRTRC system protein F n=2 Tax=Mucilaginibacter rubeus TaxID=2027860 RepID=A0A5C1HLM5_9SPHI|nr:hypothetical protein [Mucilaginibacter rubeus]QEM06181.1 hypothetical protein DIU31_022665 [Mucilaginibacter rubeus]QEM13698.1 hypothetical protein DEO27_028020 [Mucilaginibacter rubeus]QTE64159.1 hypothetical protein J3L22_03790 [Mucilaginibacter rubeus]